jgi:hypothetical protein
MPSNLQRDEKETKEEVKKISIFMPCNIFCLGAVKLAHIFRNTFNAWALHYTYKAEWTSLLGST